MARDMCHAAAILDADVVDASYLDGKLESGWATRRLEPAVARHGGRLINRTGDGARAEFPSASDALGAAIEFQQAMARVNRGQPDQSAIVFRLGLHFGDERIEDGARRGGIVISAPLRDALAGRVKASFAELGSAGLGTVEQPVRAYEVGWDPADWPTASAAAAMPITARGDRKPLGRWTLVFVWAVLLVGVSYLSLTPRSQWGPASVHLPSAASLERRATSAFVRWQEAGAHEQDQHGEEPANADSAQSPDAYDGLYAGSATMRADGRAVTFRLKVTNGIGSGTQSRLDCGPAPVALRISPSGDVGGMALVFGSTCLKTELAIRGRAATGTLRLWLASHYFELTKAGD